MNIHPEVKYNLFNMFVSFSDIYFGFEAIKILTGGVLEGTIPLSLRRPRTTCLNYELDAYLDALKSFPKTNIKLKTEKGIAVCQKTDIFKGIMWYAYEGEWINWFKLTTEQSNAIIALNKSGEKATSLEDYAAELSATIDNKIDFENVVGQDSLTRFDKPKKNKRQRNKKRHFNRKPRNENNQSNKIPKVQKNAN